MILTLRNEKPIIFSFLFSHLTYPVCNPLWLITYSLGLIGILIGGIIQLFLSIKYSFTILSAQKIVAEFYKKTLFFVYKLCIIHSQMMHRLAHIVGPDLEGELL